jgi:hypothetical protein
LAEIDLAGRDQRPDPHERSPGRYQERNERQRFAKGQQHHDWGRPGLVDTNEFQDLLRVGFDRFEHGNLLAWGQSIKADFRHEVSIKLPATLLLSDRRKAPR